MYDYIPYEETSEEDCLNLILAGMHYLCQSSAFESHYTFPEIIEEIRASQTGIFASKDYCRLETTNGGVFQVMFSLVSSLPMTVFLHSHWD